MSATGRSLREASSNLANHLNRTLNRTLTHRRLISFIERGANVSTIQFREAGRAVPTRLNSRYGPVDLEVTLRCTAEEVGSRRVRLRATWYRYTLLPEGHREPTFRWEYVSEPEGDDAFWARHHLQGPAPIDVGSRYVSLNDLHVPTGPVPIEEIIRFCINDLGVSPLSNDWHAILAESARISQQISG
jgi:hypothetical protein